MASLDDTLAQISETFWKDYLNNTVGQEQKLIDQYYQLDTRDDAMKDAVTARRILGQMDQRNRSRYGVSSTGDRAAYEARVRQLGERQAVASAYNDATLSDHDTKTNILGSLLTQGQALRNSALQGLGAAAQLEADRHSFNNAQQAAYKQRKAGLFGAGLGMAAAFGI